MAVDRVVRMLVIDHDAIRADTSETFDRDTSCGPRDVMQLT